MKPKRRALSSEKIGSNVPVTFVPILLLQVMVIVIIVRIAGWGLMELVVLNIGCDLGILSAEVFAMMVLMALVTTFLTSPALRVINVLFRSKKVPVP